MQYAGTSHNKDKTIREQRDEIERLRGRIKTVHKLVTSLFWDGAIDQDDANKIHHVLRTDEQPVVEK